MYFFLISPNYPNTEVTFNLLMKQKKSSMVKMMRLILEEVIMSVRHIPNEQMYSYLQEK